MVIRGLLHLAMRNLDIYKKTIINTFCALKITNMATVQKFEVKSDNFEITGLQR